MTKQDNQARAEREAISEARASVFNQPFRIGTGKPILRVPRPNAPIPQSKPTPLCAPAT